MSSIRPWLVICALSVAVSCGQAAQAAPPTLDAARAYGYLQKICRIGARPSGSRGMTEQQTVLAEHFTKLGAQVGYQPFDAADPVSGAPVRMSNLIVTWHPKMTERVLICCHYDTRPPRAFRGSQRRRERSCVAHGVGKSHAGSAGFPRCRLRLF
jgi:glutaminyl-peptide cyclotransferase